MPAQGRSVATPWENHHQESLKTLKALARISNRFRQRFQRSGRAFLLLPRVQTLG